MVLILIIANLFIILYLLPLFVLPCLFSHPNEIKLLSQTDLNPLVHRYQAVCIVCKEVYKPSCKISTLSCSPKHYLHTSCLHNYLSKDKKCCPFCSCPILILDNSFSTDMS